MRPGGDRDRDVLTFEGTIASCHRGGFYRVDCQLGAMRRELLVKASGHLVQKRIKLVAGDRVRVEATPYDLTRGRITWRL
jgi:translation initiation factor IF-1